MMPHRLVLLQMTYYSPTIPVFGEPSFFTHLGYSSGHAIIDIGGFCVEVMRVMVGRLS